MTTEDGKIHTPTKDIDLDLLIFVEKYATNFLKWDLLLYFGQYPTKQIAAQEIANQLGLNYRAIRPELGDLAMLGILNKLDNHSGPVYQLTTDATLRDLTLRFFRKKPPTSSGKKWLYKMFR